MKTTKVKGTTCPHCSRNIEAATSIYEDAKPKAGDLTVCAYCFAVLKWDVRMNLIELTPTDKEQMKEDNPMAYENMLQAIALVKFIRLSNNEKERI